MCRPDVRRGARQRDALFLWQEIDHPHRVGEPMLDMLAEPIGRTGTPFANANAYASHTLSP